MGLKIIVKKHPQLSSIESNIIDAQFVRGFMEFVLLDNSVHEPFLFL